MISMSKKVSSDKNNKTQPHIVTIALLGIDGTGKSTHGKSISSWLKKNKVDSVIIPFHKWIFAHKLKKVTYDAMDRDFKKVLKTPKVMRKNSLAAIIKPVIQITDNILMYFLSINKAKPNKVVIFDRFICATFIKAKALNYNVEWLRPIWMNFRPDIALIFDVPVKVSISRQSERDDPYIYTEKQLSIERKEYLKFARKFNYPVFDSTESLTELNSKVKNYLKRELISYGYNLN